jgi:growth factor-regulated tyrosine kinase substrate
MQPRSARVDDGFDEDLKRALAMSLEEVNGHSGSGYVPQAALQSSKPTTTNSVSKAASSKPAEEEDDDLKAAIAASLADMEEQKKKHTATIKEQATSSGVQASGTFALPKSDYELTPVEAENINLFSTLVDRLQTQPPGTILREPQIQELYESIGKLRPKLARTYGETMSKHGKLVQHQDSISQSNHVDALLDLHAKLSTVVRYYDRMLEERLSNTYNQHSIGGYNLPPQRPTSTMYPSIASNPSAPGAVENFYTGNAQHEPYPRPQSTFSPPNQQYQQYDIRAPAASPGYGRPEQRNDHYIQYSTQQQGVQPQISGSWQPSEPPTQFVPQQGHQAAPAMTVPTQATATINAPSQPPHMDAPPESMTTPLADPSAAFYYGNPAPPQALPPQSSTEQNQSPYPSAHQSPQQYHNAPPKQPSSPQQVTHQSQQPQQQYIPQNQQSAPPSQHQPQQQYAPPQQHPPLPQSQPPPQTVYWQGQPQNASSPPWQKPDSTYNGYTQDSFPSAPQHSIQPKVMEESLIDL